MANDFKIKNGLQLGGAFVEKVGTISGNADVDLSTGNVFDYTPTADATFTFSNAGETEHSFVLSVVGAEVAAGFDLANAAYDSVSFSVAGQDGNPNTIFFKPDGLKMYMVGFDGADVNEYNLSTAWDVSTASYLQNFSLSSQDTLPYGIFFKPDGTKMYVSGDTGNVVSEYNLSTAWDISTASYLQNFSVAAQETQPRGLFFKPDGLKMYVAGRITNSMLEYNLSAAWDISTASYVHNFTVVGSNPFDMFFSNDGTKMYVLFLSGQEVKEYSLSTAWNISTSSYFQNFSVAAQETSPTGLFFESNGAKMYVIGTVSDTIYQYSTVAATTAPATFTYPASVAWPSGTAPDAPADGEIDILEFSTTDGGTTWYGVRTGDAMA